MSNSKCKFCYSSSIFFVWRGKRQFQHTPKDTICSSCIWYKSMPSIKKWIILYPPSTSYDKNQKIIWQLYINWKSNTTYRVIIKQGQKVNANYTAKMCLFWASMEFILTTSCGHLIIYTKDLKYFTLNVFHWKKNWF